MTWESWDDKLTRTGGLADIAFVVADVVQRELGTDLFRGVRSSVASIHQLIGIISARNGINAKIVFLAQTKCRREMEKERKRRERRKGKGNWKWSFGRNGSKKLQTPQPGIEPGTPANAADVLPISHRDKRYRQQVCLKFYQLCLHFTT